MAAMSQKRTTIVDSAQPTISKWWCSGAILNTRLRRVLYEVTWMTTDIKTMTSLLEHLVADE